MGLLGTAGKYGIGLGFLANTFFASNGGGASVSNIKGAIEGLGINADFLDNGAIKGFIDGKEGPLSLILGSMFTFSGDLQKFGVVAGLGWLGVQLFQSYKRGELKNAMNQAASGLGLDSAPAPVAVRKIELSGITAGMERMVAQGAVAQGRSQPDGGARDIDPALDTNTPEQTIE